MEILAKPDAIPVAKGFTVEAKVPIPAPNKTRYLRVAAIKMGINNGKKAMVSSHMPKVVPPSPNKIINMGISRFFSAVEFPDDIADSRMNCTGFHNDAEKNHRQLK